MAKRKINAKKWIYAQNSAIVVPGYNKYVNEADVMGPPPDYNSLLPYVPDSGWTRAQNSGLMEPKKAGDLDGYPADPSIMKAYNKSKRTKIKPPSGDVITAGIMAVDALIPQERNPWPVVRPPMAYNEHQYGIYGSGANAQYGTTVPNQQGMRPIRQLPSMYNYSLGTDTPFDMFEQGESGFMTNFSKMKSSGQREQPDQSMSPQMVQQKQFTPPQPYQSHQTGVRDDSGIGALFAVGSALNENIEKKKGQLTQALMMVAQKGATVPKEKYTPKQKNHREMYLANNKDYPVNKGNVEQIISTSVGMGYSPEKALAVALQETGMGRVDENYFHVTGPQETHIPFSNPNYAVEQGVQSLKDKEKLAKRLGYNTPEMMFQTYNGLGKIFPKTEQSYHGFKMKSIYGVPLPEEGIDMKKNPLYGKRIVDLQNNVIGKDQFVKDTTKKYQDFYNNPDSIYNTADTELPGVRVRSLSQSGIEDIAENPYDIHNKDRSVGYTQYIQDRIGEQRTKNFNQNNGIEQGNRVGAAGKAVGKNIPKSKKPLSGDEDFFRPGTHGTSEFRKDLVRKLRDHPEAFKDGGNIPISNTGYKRDSPHVNEKQLRIPSNHITMQDVDIPLQLVASNGQRIQAYPGDPDVIFPKSVTHVDEYPMAQFGRTVPSHPQSGGKTVANKSPENIRRQVFDQYPALSKVAPMDSFHVDYAQGKDVNTLRQMHHNPEYIGPNEGVVGERAGNTYIPKGKMLVGDNKFVNANYPGQYTTLIDSAGKSQQDLVNMAGNDFFSHSMHRVPEYNQLSSNLNNSLVQKYGKQHVNAEGGVDAYVRGMMDNSPEYAPYRTEMNGIDTSATNPMKRFINKGKRMEDGGTIYAQDGTTTPPNDPKPYFKTPKEREKFRTNFTAESEKALEEGPDNKYLFYSDQHPAGHVDNCINGIDGLCKAAGLKYNNPPTRIPGANRYLSNTDFSDAIRDKKEDYYQVSGNFQVGDHIQYLNSDGIAHHSKAIYKITNDGPGGAKRYHIIHNGGGNSFRENIYNDEQMKGMMDGSNKKDLTSDYSKINIYRPGYGLDKEALKKERSEEMSPEAKKALEDRASNIQYNTTHDPNYTYSIRPDSKYAKNPPIGMKRFMEYANDQKKIDEMVVKLNGLGLTSKADKASVHNSLLNVYGILGQENKWEDRLTGGTGGIENTWEQAAARIPFINTKGYSIGPGQIKYGQLDPELKKAFNITNERDLFSFKKIIPLMVAMDIKNRKWMEGQGKNLSNRITGDPGGSSSDLKGDEARWSPYFYQGLGPGIRKSLEKEAEGKIWDGYRGETRARLVQQYVEKHLPERQKNLDKGSYAEKVYRKISENLQRTSPKFNEEKELEEVILPPVKAKKTIKQKPRHLGSGGTVSPYDYMEGQEYDLPEEEIQRLIKKGYKLKYT